VTDDDGARERHLQQLAGMLFFKVEKQGSRYALSRNADVSAPVRHENLSIEEAERILNTWKLRGLHGG
jgi:hypothetical protein